MSELIKKIVAIPHILGRKHLRQNQWLGDYWTRWQNGCQESCTKGQRSRLESLSLSPGSRLSVRTWRPPICKAGVPGKAESCCIPRVGAGGKISDPAVSVPNNSPGGSTSPSKSQHSFSLANSNPESTGQGSALKPQVGVGCWR